MVKRKHDMGLCSFHGCRKKASVELLPDGISGAMLPMLREDTQPGQGNLLCDEHFNKKLSVTDESMADIVAQGKNHFKVVAIQEKVIHG